MDKHKKYKLNHRQQLFVNLVASGENQTRAYMEAYDEDNYNNAASNGSRLMKNDKVQVALQEAAPEAFQTLAELMREAKSEQVKLKATESILDRTGYAPIRKVQSQTMKVNIEGVIDNLEDGLNIQSIE